MPGVINVLFDVPEWITQGLVNGTLLRRGGVIQWAFGSKRGEVAAWLRESGGLLERVKEGVPVPPLVGPEFARIGLGVQAVLGMQVLTLAVTAIGFTLMLSRLSAIDQKLDLVLKSLQKLESDISWLDRRLDAVMMAKISGSLEAAAWAERTGRLEQLAALVPSLLEAEHHLQDVMSAMLWSQRATVQHKLYVSYFAMRALVGVGRARVHALIDGASEGAAVATAVAQNLRRWRETFQTSALQHSPEMYRQCSPKVDHLVPPSVQCLGVLGRVKGALAPLGGAAALDPPYARQVLTTIGESGEVVWSATPFREGSPPWVRCAPLARAN